MFICRNMFGQKGIYRNLSGINVEKCYFFQKVSKIMKKVAL